MKDSIKLMFKFTVSIILFANVSFAAKENKSEIDKDGTHPLISLKDWFEWVSDPITKCEKYDDKVKAGKIQCFIIFNESGTTNYMNEIWDIQ